MNDLLDELLLGSPPVHKGRDGVPLSATYSRDLTEADLAALAAPRGTATPTLQRIHSSHHALARCLATGMKTYDASLVTGYSPQRINQLERDPLFCDLVAYYKIEAKEVIVDLTERMQSLSRDAIEALHDRLREKPEDFSVGMLLDTVKAMADRTGHGPNTDVNLNIAGAGVDRPPRETHEEWEARRRRELAYNSVGSPTGTPN